MLTLGAQAQVIRFNQNTTFNTCGFGDIVAFINVPGGIAPQPIYISNLHAPTIFPTSEVLNGTLAFVNWSADPGNDYYPVTSSSFTSMANCSFCNCGQFKIDIDCGGGGTAFCEIPEFSLFKGVKIVGSEKTQLRVKNND